jgi:uncharacterized protein YjiS (DUF1127 family)
MEPLRSIQRAWIQYREFEKVRHELGDSSDRQLADMGIARGDIPTIAFAHAEEEAARLVPPATQQRSVRSARGGGRLRFARTGHPR